MDTDDRFKHLASDPRFKNLRRKQKKVKIDDRFQSMFTDERFTLKYKKNKRGWTENKTSGDDLKRYYSLDDNRDGDTNNDKVEVTKEQGELETDKKSAKNEVLDIKDGSDSGEDDEEREEDVDDDEGVDGEDEATDISSSSDEADSEVEADGGQEDEVEINRIQYDWQPLDHDAATSEETSERLAIQNIDWDHLDVKDIYILINSVRPPKSVTIYVSEFGKERLKQEELEGPKELVEAPKSDDEDEEEYNMLKEKMEAFSNKDSRVSKVNEYDDADEEIDFKNEKVRERIRRYQLSRMKYYYAVAEFDSIESAEAVYKELDGMEYEGSSLELDLRFVPEDIEFNPEDIKSACNKLPDPASYKAPQFINSALQQTTVKFTWDETDTKRQEQLHRAYTKGELDKDDLEAYLASETESEQELEEDEDEEQDDLDSTEARADKYRRLLKSLEEEEERKKKVDVDVEWGDYSGDESEVKPEKEVEVDSIVESSRSHPKKKRKKNRAREDSHLSEEGEENDELDLLVMDGDNKQEEFTFNPDDDRFKAVYESGLYNIDPSHPNFKTTPAFKTIAEKKRQRKTNKMEQQS